MTRVPATRVLVWQWGRRGAGPRVASELAAGLAAARLDGLPATEPILSLSTGAEILRARDRPDCALPVETYDGMASYLRRLAFAPLMIRRLRRRIAELRPDFALCAMPGPLDLVMAAALASLGVPVGVVVHDADRHPGDGFPLQMTLQRRLIRRARLLVALTVHVEARLRAQGLDEGRRLLRVSLPPFGFGPEPPPPLSHGGPMRLLCFGRLLPYKGLDLLEQALRLAAASGAALPPFELRVVGQGPDSPTLQALAGLPGVRVENRWVPEDEVGELIAWSDALLLPYREASQSGVAAIAAAAGRWVLGTAVGGLAEQLAAMPMARLCEPHAAGLAASLRGLLVEPPPLVRACEPRRAWQAMAEVLLVEIGLLLGLAPTAPVARPVRQTEDVLPA